MKKALICGITGQDGSYLAELLLRKGYEVHGLIRRASTFNTQRIDHLYVDPHQPDARLFLHYGDLSDGTRLVTLLSKIEPDEVYNLGAQSHVRVSFDEPEHTGDITGLGSVRLLEALRIGKVNCRLYQASSSEMFGASPPPQNEQTDFYPRSPYGAAKVYAYWMTRNYREAYGMFTVNGILFNHESPRRGETFVTRKITRAVARIKAGLDHHVYLGNLDAVRDWGYAPEYVEGMWRMLQADEPDDYVLATGDAYTVRDFAEAAFAHASQFDRQEFLKCWMDVLPGSQGRAVLQRDLSTPMWVLISVGAVMYAVGLVTMRYAATPLSLDLSAGVLIGLGLSGCSFNLVLSAFGKLLRPEWRGVALGAGTAAGSFGQFVFAPFGVAMLDNFGWQPALIVFAGLMLLVVPLSLALATPASDSTAVAATDQQTFKHALAEAFGHRSYVLLVLGFFTCGFQLAFITVHLPAYLVDRGMPVQTGGWVIAVIGLFNIVGSLSVGWLQSRLPKRYILSAIYFARAMSIVAFISFPITTFSAIAFGVVTGLTWLSTVPPTSSLVALMFGTRWLATLYGFAFFSHQVGGFLGVLLGGIVFEKFGSYTPIWWLSVLFGVLSALINLPIIEAPVARPVAQPA